MTYELSNFKEHVITEQILQHSTDLISLHARSGAIVYASPSIFVLLGYDEKELIGKSVADFLHPDDRARLSTHRTEYYFHKYVSARIRRKEGDYIWVETIMQPLKYFTDGGDDLILCISRDITARKIAEDELNEIVERYRRLVEYSHDTIGIITKKGTITYINETGKKLFGATSTSEIIGKTIYEFTPAYDHEKIKKFIVNNGLYKDVSDFIETSLIRLDNEVRLIDMKFTMLSHRKKRKQLIIRDITDRKLTEEKLQQTEKLSVVGHLAAGIAHEIRNPLTAIKGFTQLLKEEYNTSYADVMIAELDRIDKIVGDLLILAKPEIQEFQTSNLNELIQDLYDLLKTQAIMNNIELTIDFSHENILIECEQDKLKQVFINIIKNSLEAIEKNGEISIACEKIVEKNEVRVTIRDNGIGIPPERLPKLGEPFYSTKEKGTGLGLMICKKIIKDHNGTLHISSKLNEGTVVTITLPIRQKN